MAQISKAFLGLEFCPYNEHGNSDHTSSQEGNCIGGKTQTIKNLRSIIKDSVDASPLLEEHDYCGDDHAPEHWHGLEERTDGNELTKQIH